MVIARKSHSHARLGAQQVAALQGLQVFVQMPDACLSY